jgi:hypothetical protein
MHEVVTQDVYLGRKVASTGTAVALDVLGAYAPGRDRGDGPVRHRLGRRKQDGLEHRDASSETGLLHACRRKLQAA